jgi:hypothetical protein
MGSIWRLSFVVIVLTLTPTLTPIQAWAEWVMWVEAPVGSDQWSIAAISQARFKAKQEISDR